VFQLQLWSTKTGEQIVCFYHADKPAFTLDCKYLLYIDSGRTLIIYCLSRMAPLRYIACEADQLLVLPVKHRLVVITSTSTTSCPSVGVWDVHEGRQLVSLSDVAPGGLRDISKDGLLAVDASVQVFSLDTGVLKSHVEGADKGDVSFVRLTDDSQFVVWVDALSVKVSRVMDGSLIARACTHERPASLCTLDCGYVLVVGRQDGRILMMTLLPDSHQQSSRPRTADERASTLHRRLTCSDQLHAGVDLMYHYTAHAVRDSDIQRASESVRSVLSQRAKAPLLSTAVSKLAADPAADKYQRSYSQLTPITDLHETPARLTAAESYHDIASSSSCLEDTDLSPVTAAGYRRSTDDDPLLTRHEQLLNRRSRSVTDVMALCTLKTHNVRLQSRADSLTRGTAHKSSDAGAAAARTPARKLIGYLVDFGANIRSKRKKYPRRRVATDTDNRDRMPSV